MFRRKGSSMRWEMLVRDEDEMDDSGRGGSRDKRGACSISSMRRDSSRECIRGRRGSETPECPCYFYVVARGAARVCISIPLESHNDIKKRKYDVQLGI